MTSVSKYVYIDTLDDIVNKYINTCHSSIKMKPVDVKASTYIGFSKEINDKDPKFKIGDIVKLQKYCDIVKISLQKVKNTVRGHLLIMILMEKKFLAHFTKKNGKKQMKKSLEMKN